LRRHADAVLMPLPGKREAAASPSRRGAEQRRVPPRAHARDDVDDDYVYAIKR